MFRIYNFVAYQLAWFACVLGAAHDLAWLGAAFALTVAAAHLALRPAAIERPELRLIAAPPPSASSSTAFWSAATWWSSLRQAGPAGRLTGW